MLLTADALVSLPFALDFCAAGPDVPPLVCTLENWQATLYFPPSLSDDTDGQGIFGDWAWWTGKTLRVVLERAVSDADDADALRADALHAGNETLRRFLNACRVRFSRPEFYPVPIDPRRLTLTLVRDDGRRETLPEPVSAFFYQTMPNEPPVQQSISAETLAALQADVQSGTNPPLAAQWELDAQRLDAQGERQRAALLRERAP